jgi:hypothetical protein
MPNKRTAKANPIEERRKEQLTQLEESLRLLRQHQASFVNTKRKVINLLKSTAHAHYEEIDKLAKKAPAALASDLAVEEINYVILEVRNLMPDDVMIQRQKPFVPAGTNPEVRDVVFVLRQIIAGLERADAQAIPAEGIANGLISQVRSLKTVIQASLEGKVIKNETFEKRWQLDNSWFSEEFPHLFDFTKLDALDIINHFRIADDN